MAQEMSQPQMLQINSPAALQRFENWRNNVAQNPLPIQDFAKNNYAPTQPTPYDKWLERQNSFEGRKHTSQRLAQEQKRSEMMRRAQFNTNKPEPSGQQLGVLKDLNSNQSD